MPVAAVLVMGADERLALKSPYNPDLVTALKDAIPYHYREFDRPAKTWRIDPEWGEVLIAALEAIGIAVVDKRPATAPTPTVAQALAEACRRLTILPEAPVEVAEAAYKAWAKLCHPDVGGSTEQMQEINDAIATFKSFNEEIPF